MKDYNDNGQDQTEKVFIDYGSGLHGKFLSYVIDTYIYGYPKVKNIFDQTGASHLHETVTSNGHYSQHNTGYGSDIDKVIYIKHNPDCDFIALVNIMHRCPDPAVRIGASVESIKAHHYSSLHDTTNDCNIRNDFFAKLEKRDFAHGISKQNRTSLPVFCFDITAFFTLGDFLFEMRKTADFMNLLFLFDESIVILYTKFIKLNQGYQFHNKSNYLLNCIYSGKSEQIEKNNFIHAYINHKISKVFNIYDGMLFEGEYPNNTIEIHNIILNKIEEIKKE
jgi:hypothetical protein